MRKNYKKLKIIGKPFTLVFLEKYFQKNDWLTNKHEGKSFLGFKFIWYCFIIDNPCTENDFYKYTAQLKRKELW